ncbi:MAG: flagellar basal body L-ring protein FlgH [Paracoccaceae bacterium]
MRIIGLSLILAVGVAGCSRLEQVGKAPEMTPITQSTERTAMLTPPLPVALAEQPPTVQASLWSRSQSSLLGDRRAIARGDIMTVVIEIDERAEISNSSDRSRSASEDLSVPNLFGIPQRIDQNAQTDASLSSAVQANSSSSSSGDGSVKRREKLTLRVAATVVDVLPNGVLAISGSQEVRVNFELRELMVTGYVRPSDISRQNEITYDKIASARVSYGGRGQISDVQQPRLGQQVLDVILPF